MDIVSIIFLIIIAVFIIIGLVKGFARSVIDFAGNILVLLGSILLTKPTSAIATNLHFISERKNDIVNYLNNFNPLFSEMFTKDNKEGISLALSELNIPGILNTILVDKIINYIPENGIILSEVLSTFLIKIVVTVICFILIFITLKILFLIVKVLSKKLIESIKPIKRIDKLLGASLGLLIGVIIVNILCLLITISLGVPIMNNFNTFLISQMKLNTNGFTLSKFIYENNLLVLIIAWLI